MLDHKMVNHAGLLSTQLHNYHMKITGFYGSAALAATGPNCRTSRETAAADLRGPQTRRSACCGIADGAGHVVDRRGGGGARPPAHRARDGGRGVKELLALGKALSITEHPPAGAWWVKLKQAATIGAIAGAPVGYAMGNSDAGSAVSGAGLAILLTPKALGTLTANPSMLKAFKDGIQASSQQQRVTPALDFILTSLRQATAAKLAPTSPRQSAITPDQPSSQDMKTSLGGKSISTLLKPAAPGITSER